MSTARVRTVQRSTCSYVGRGLPDAPYALRWANAEITIVHPCRGAPCAPLQHLCATLTAPSVHLSSTHACKRNPLVQDRRNKYPAPCIQSLPGGAAEGLSESTRFSSCLLVRFPAPNLGNCENLQFLSKSLLLQLKRNVVYFHVEK